TENRGAVVRAQGGAHGSHRDPQSSAGGAGIRKHGVLLPRTSHRSRCYGSPLHEPPGAAHGGVRYREVWMSPESAAAGRQPGFRHFHDQLEELKQRLLRMCERAESLVDLAVEALLTRDADKAEAVVAGDRGVDEL